MTSRSVSLARWVRDTKVLSWVIAVVAVVAGLAYILYSPVTTSRYFDGSWTAVIWGTALLAGGTMKLIGLKTKVLDWQLLGLGFMLAGVFMIAVGQSLVMSESGWPPTRLGGVCGWWMTFTLVANRLVLTACDRVDGQEAQEQINEGR